MPEGFSSSFIFCCLFSAMKMTSPAGQLFRFFLRKGLEYRGGVMRSGLGLAVFLLTTLCAAAQAAEEGAASGDEAASKEDSEGAPKEGAAKTAEKAPNPEDARSPEEDVYGHGGQFGLRLGLQGGYRMIFRYDHSPFCTPFDFSKTVKKQNKFCGHASPLAIDVAPSFAPVDAVELFLWGRFGLSGEDDTDTDPLLVFGGGVRLYTMSDSRFKIFIEPGVAFEVEGGQGDPVYQQNQPQYKTDLLFHLAAGPQYDVSKGVGLYLDAGMTTGIFRAIHSTLELTGGVQVRVP
jgi:hypothetical protein